MARFRSFGAEAPSAACMRPPLATAAAGEHVALLQRPRCAEAAQMCCKCVACHLTCAAPCARAQLNGYAVAACVAELVAPCTSASPIQGATLWSRGAKFPATGHASARDDDSYEVFGVAGASPYPFCNAAVTLRDALPHLFTRTGADMSAWTRSLVRRCPAALAPFISCAVF